MRTSEDQAAFDRAVRRFNERAFFEAHEDWEDVWRGALGDEKRWLQGLIQWAAAFVHYERGFHATGFVKLIREGRAKVEGYEGPTWGLDAPRLLRDMQAWFGHAERVDAGADLVHDAPARLPRMHARDASSA